MEPKRELHPKETMNTKANIAFVAFVLIAAYFLITEHWAHLVPYWPYLLVLACPLMHLFMHHGHHGRHGRYGHGGQRSREDDNRKDSGTSP